MFARRNNSSSTAADISIPQVSSLAPSVATADSLIVTARTTTKELQPNIFNLDTSSVKTQNLDNLSRKGPSSDNLSTRDQQQTEKMIDQLSEGVTDTVINLKGSVKKYMEIVRNNSTKSEEESPATTTPAAGRTTAGESSEVTSTARTSTTASVVVTTTPGTTKMFPKKTTTVRSTTAATTISSSTRPSTTARTTTESANTRFATEEPPNTERNEQEIGISTDSSGLKKEPSPVLDLEVEDGQVAPPVSRVVKNIDEDAGEATKRGGQLENQLDSALPVPARPLVVNRTNQEALQADFPPGRPDLPRQREELKKDLLEAIKRKISKNRPGGDERSHQGRHKLFHTKPSWFVSRMPDNVVCF